MNQVIDIDKIIAIAEEAGNAIMEVYGGNFEVMQKEDRSPVTEADRKANAVILHGLSQLYPDIPYISEETRQLPYEKRKEWKRLWIIDPLDGTKEFIKRNGEFTVNIALVENGIPVMGVVYVPVQSLTYAGIKGAGSFKLVDGKRVTISNPSHYSNKNSITVVASRSHLSPETGEFIEKLKAGGKQVEFVSSGSSIKICMVAEGKADVYPRFAPTMEWDTAAAHAVALYADCKILDAQSGKPLVYNKEDLRNPFFVVE